MTDDTLRELFEEAFSDGIGTSLGTCVCGRTFYNADESWSFEAGQLEALQADTKATRTDYGVGYLSFEGCTYIDACDCWWPRAKKLAGFILDHGRGIAAFLNLNKRRQIAGRGETARSAGVPAMTEGE